MLSRGSGVACLIALTFFGPAASQETGSLISEKGIASSSDRFRLKGEIKLNARGSSPEEVRVTTPTGVVFERTVSPHGSFEISDIVLIGEADLTPDIAAKVELHFLDLYNRNPTSTDEKIAVRQAWLRLGQKYEPFRKVPGTSVYLQMGKAPRFSKQLVRRLESYGLWGTAVGRLEEIGVEAGGTFGKFVYWRAHVVNGNPLFMRDPNALAGDNGTPDREPGRNVPTVYQSGFPILYDTKAGDLNFRGKFQYGGGLGFRFLSDGGRNGVDVLGWYFRRTLADRVAIDGTFYSGDLRLLQGLLTPSLPLQGRDKIEYGANLEARFAGASLYGQIVRQEIAGLVRKGFEVEVAYRIPLNGLFVSGDSPVINWVAPTLRFSSIDNQFSAPPGFVAPSFGWDWEKTDYGLRVGILRGVDLTAEYSRHAATARTRTVRPDEFLMTLRAGF